MKNLKFLICLIMTTPVLAHEPYLAPLSYHTENTQIPVVAGYAEEALNSEHALKNSQITVTSPQKQTSQLELASSLKSASLADLTLPVAGTYLLETKASFPLNYVKDQNEWKLFFEMPADKAPVKAERDFMIPDDFKNKKYTLEKITREWTLQSYVTKDKASLIPSTGTAPIQVAFTNHPALLKAGQPETIKISKSQQALKNAEVNIRAKGATDKEAIQFKANAQGEATLVFPQPGEYLVEVSEHVDMSQKPQNQYFTIVSVFVQATK